jgi:zinc and cadmium transporter
MNPWIGSLVSVALVSLVSLVGVATLSFSEQRLRRLATLLVSFAVGALLGDAFLHLIPESLRHAEASPQPSLLVLGGMLLFFVLEKLLRHQHGVLHEHHHPAAGALPRLAVINVVGDALHNFIDGALIAASFLVGPELGIATSVAVLLHEIPQELGDFGVLVHSGLRPARALLLNVASASVAFAGAIATLLVGEVAGELVTRLMVPVAAGGFVYIAAADLIPELQHDRSMRGLLLQAGLIAAGVAAMAALAAIE